MPSTLTRTVAMLALVGAALALTSEPTLAAGMSERAREVIAAARGGEDKVDLIVRYRRAPSARDADEVARLGGQVRRALPLIDGHAIRVPAHVAERLQENPNVSHISADERLSAAFYTTGSSATGSSVISQPAGVMHAYPELAGLGLTGSGVTVAVIDSGVRGHIDAGTTEAESLIYNGPLSRTDPYGHGNHVTGIIQGNGTASAGAYRGIAPGSNVVSLQALDETGGGMASDVIAALQWVLENHQDEGIRVVNLSLGHPVRESVTTDPLVQAVEAVWDAGVVVVASAGNYGNDGYGTITSPGNAPSIITVGSFTHWGDSDPANDIVSTYSSRGPTAGDLIMKPDLLASGNRVISFGTRNSTLMEQHPEWIISNALINGDYFQLSGTSMAAAVVTGAVALMLEQNPTLNPATVKARLMRSADKTQFPDTFATGAGVLDISAALAETGTVQDAPSPRAQRIEDIGMIGFEDTTQLWGSDEWSLSKLWGDGYLWANGQQWVNGYAWTESSVTAEGYLWADGYLWAEGYLWANGYLWADAYLWADGYLWAEGYLWANSDLFAEGYLWGNGYLWANGSTSANTSANASELAD